MSDIIDMIDHRHHRPKDERITRLFTSINLFVYKIKSAYKVLQLRYYQFRNL